MGDSFCVDEAGFTYANFIPEIQNDPTIADYLAIFPPIESPSRSDDPFGILGSVNNLSVTDYSTPNVMTESLNLDSNSSQKQTGHTSDLSVGSEPTLGQPELSSYTQESCESRVSSLKPHACLITGCTQRFNRTDSRTSHLRRKHRLRIPRGCWAKTWISKSENRHHHSAAVAEQARANSILSPQTETEN